MENETVKTWKPVTAGILNIITGALAVLSALGLILAIISVGSMGITSFVPPRDVPFVAPLATTVLAIILVFSLISAVFPIIGGVFAVQRQKWGWALAGSIIAIVGLLPLGVLATIFLALSKDEFK